MNFELNDDHRALRDSASVFLNKEVDLTPLLVPGAGVEQSGSENLWPKVVEMGWPGIVVPEAYGGIGLGYIDLIMVTGEMGRTLAPTPLFGGLAGGWVIEAAGSEAQKFTYLGALASGETALALAVLSEDGDFGGDNTKAAVRGGKTVLSGVWSYVVDAASADKIVVAIRNSGEDEFYVVDRNALGVDVKVLDWRDITRQVCQVMLKDVEAEPLEAGGSHVWPWVRDRLYLVLASESAEGIGAVLDEAVGYSKDRVAFGRPIGSFQAIKHQLAEIAGERELAVASVQYAAWALSEGDERASLAAAMAQSYCSEAYKKACHRNIQVFGAIGFTWEMKNHLYYKRARSNSELLGAPSQQREEVIKILEKTA